MTDQAFIPAADAGTLSARCAASLRANGALMASLLSDLPPLKLKSIEDLIAGGGSVGIETLVDKHATNRVALVGIEREGRRLVLAEVTAATIDSVH